MVFPSDFSSTPKDNTAQPPGNTHSIRAQPDHESFTAHESTTSQSTGIGTTEHFAPAQAITIPEDPSLSKLGSDSLEGWAWDPHFFFQPEINDHAHAQNESASYSHTPSFGRLSPEGAFVTDPPYINHATKPYRGRDRVGSQGQVDQQCNTRPPDASQPVISLEEYRAELHLDHGEVISPRLLHQGVLGYIEPSTYNTLGNTNSIESYHPTTMPRQNWSYRINSEPTIRYLGCRPGIPRTLQITRDSLYGSPNELSESSSKHELALDCLTIPEDEHRISKQDLARRLLFSA